MDKNKKLLMAGAAMVALGGLAAQDVQAATQAIPMNATVLAPIQLNAGDSLNFGELTVATGAGGTVVVDNANGRTATGGVTLVGTTATSGDLQITAAATGRNIVIQAPASDTVTNGTANMVVNNFIVDTAGSDRTLTTTFGAFPATVPIGATLNVGAGQATGDYTGSFDVTVNYQ